MTLRAIALGIPAISILLAAEPARAEPGPQPGFVFCCAADNDLYGAMTAGGERYERFATPAETVRAAPEGAGVLVLADGYPEKRTEVEPAVLDEAARKKLRLYVEYPTALPGLELGEPQEVKLERGVVASDFFGDALPPMRIVMLNGCRFLPARADHPHLVLARVAGVDTAVFGLGDATCHAILFDHPRGDLLVATTSLSRFVTARYMPAEAWRAIWRAILARLQPGVTPPQLPFTPTIRPSYPADAPLPADAEREALARSANWMIRSRILRHPQWPKEALDRALGYNTVRDMPAADWPVGDGSLGVLEGFSSTIRADGSQPMRYAVRNDCLCEVAMEMALDGVVNSRPQNAAIAANLLDYTLVTSPLAQGPRTDPESPSYGLVGWSLDSQGSYWGDDNARAMLGVLTVAAALQNPRWDEAMVRCLLANLRTTGPLGYRPACVTEASLQPGGWKPLWTGRHLYFSPHFEAWPWACFLWAYDKTRFAPFLDRSKNGFRLLMQAYPKRWSWCLRSGSIERARALLPLAWLVRVDDTPQHRQWLRTVAADLIAVQDSSGGIREVLGAGGQGLNSNAEYGTGENTLIQHDGDPVCDMLYTCNFALIGLHEAAAATGDPLYAEAEDKLARFLCRIQVRSEAHPELDGAWYRAFNFRQWEFWASNADWEWGPWCTETGWSQPWIAATLALRQKKTSLWELTSKSRIADHFDKYRKQMLPDSALEAPPAPPVVRHAALNRPVTLVTEADPRYPGLGPDGLVDGVLGSDKYQDGEWLGWEGCDLDATIDLGQPTPLRQVQVRVLQSNSVGILLPKQIALSVSDDGKTFRNVQTRDVAAVPDAVQIKTLAFDPLDVTARYVRVQAVGRGTISAGLPGAGNKAWLFVDEIFVNPPEGSR